MESQLSPSSFKIRRCSGIALGNTTACQRVSRTDRDFDAIAPELGRSSGPELPHASAQHVAGDAERGFGLR
jgi:hypothetical protein